MPVAPLSLAGLVLALAAVVIGVSKTSVGGFATLAVAAFASYLPAKESTAAVLLLLIVGDLVAVARYRHDASWGLLRRLLPSVLPGVALGAAFMSVVDDHTLRRSIGLLLTGMVLLQLLRRRPRRTDTGASRAPDGGGPGLLAAVAAGTTAGFTTMTANAAGPVMTLYLLASRVDKRAFVGTNAWFFMLVNLSKTPFSFALGLFPTSTLLMTAALAPFVLAGTWLGSRLVPRLSQSAFDTTALIASAVAAATLLFR